MTQLVTDHGFVPDDWASGYTAIGCANDAAALDVPSDVQPQDIPLTNALVMIRVAFPTSGDGRGFTIARQLRLRGYKGRLRAYGHLIADQYAMARRSGFDEVEINETIAARQPQEQWLARANWQAHDHQSQLRG